MSKTEEVGTYKSTEQELADQAILSVAAKREKMLEKSGHKDDGPKARIDLIPPEAIWALADVMTFGAAKYEDRNWEKGMAWSRLYAAMMRHMLAWWGGEDKDPETRYSHLWHALCCVVFLVAYEEWGMTEFDDRPE
jgi:hypothetical protein